MVLELQFLGTMYATFLFLLSTQLKEQKDPKNVLSTLPLMSLMVLLYFLVLSADTLYKQFRPRSGLTKKLGLI